MVIMYKQSIALCAFLVVAFSTSVKPFVTRECKIDTRHTTLSLSSKSDIDVGHEKPAMPTNETALV
jgi:hypothetical protein